MVEDVALGIDRGFGRVEIFRHGRHRARGSRRRRFFRIRWRWERDAAAEAIEKAAAALIARDQAGFDEKLVGIFCFQDAKERVAAAGSIADAELLDDFFGDAAIFEIGAGDFAFGSVFEVLGEKCSARRDGFRRERALLIFAAFFGRAIARCRNGDAAFFGDNADGFGKRALFHFHDKFEDVAADVAAEAVVDLAQGMNVKRRRFLGVERAESAKILPRLLQLDVFADHANDVRLLLNTIRE